MLYSFLKGSPPLPSAVLCAYLGSLLPCLQVHTPSRGVNLCEPVPRCHCISAGSCPAPLVTGDHGSGFWRQHSPATSRLCRAEGWAPRDSAESLLGLHKVEAGLCPLRAGSPRQAQRVAGRIWPRAAVGLASRSLAGPGQGHPRPLESAPCLLSARFKASNSGASSCHTSDLPRAPFRLAAFLPSA